MGLPSIAAAVRVGVEVDVPPSTESRDPDPEEGAEAEKLDDVEANGGTILDTIGLTTGEAGDAERSTDWVGDGGKDGGGASDEENALPPAAAAVEEGGPIPIAGEEEGEGPSKVEATEGTGYWEVLEGIEGAAPFVMAVVVVAVVRVGADVVGRARVEAAADD